MLEVYERQTAAAADNIHAQVVLDHLQRERGRFKAESSNGEEVRIFLERGQTLQVGEVLKTRCGKFLQVDGAMEVVLEASTEDTLLFSLGCYHLGNRHTKVQIGSGWLRITPDHVREEMLRELGLTIAATRAVFVPESGAYARGGHGHHY